LTALTDGPVAYRNRGGYKAIKSSAADIVFQSKNSTQRAMRELAQRRYEAKQRKKALFLIISLLIIASTIHYVTNSNYNLGLVLQSKSTAGVISKFILNDQGSDNSGDGAQGIEMNQQEAGDEISVTSMGDNPGQNSEINNKDQQIQGNQLGEEDLQDNIDGENELPPQEEIIEEGKEFLQPYRYFADLTTPRRQSDSNFFFHIPRSGGQTIKDIVGKCLHQTLASEVGVREGHGQDETLQHVDFNGAKYVNVDTTSIEGLNRAATMGLASSGFSDMITSSYFAEVGMLFDLHHKGRAFVLLRDPMVRAVSMYYYKTQGEVPMIDPSVSLEDYAQGQGIENNWVTRFLTGRMEGELTKEDLEQAKEIISRKFLIGFLDDGEETVYRLMKYFDFSFSDDETKKMEEEDCIKDLLKDGTNANTVEYEMPKKGSQAAALIKWQTQFDIKLFTFAKEIFDAQTKVFGSKERKKEMKKRKKEGH